MKKKKNYFFVLSMLLAVVFITSTSTLAIANSTTITTINSNNKLGEEKTTDTQESADTNNRKKTTSLAASVSLDTWMPDKNTQQLIATALNKDTEQITQQDMLTITRLDFSSLPAETKVDLTGLEFATNLKNLDTTAIIATTIPTITLVNSATLFTRPNVLAHIKPLGTFDNIHIGNYDKSLPASELAGIGAYFSNWNIGMLGIYSTAMVDYSTLQLPANVTSLTEVTIFSNNYYYLAPFELGTIHILNEQNKNISFSTNNINDTVGNPLLSSISNSSLQPTIYSIDTNQQETYLTSGVDYTLTPSGILFHEIATNVAAIQIEFSSPAFFSARANETKLTYYSVSFKLAVNWVTSGGDITVNYIDETGNDLAKSTVLSGYVGDSYTAEQKEFSGYTFKEVQGNVAGTFSENAQSVTFIYTKSADDSSSDSPNSTDTSGTMTHSETVSASSDTNTPNKKTNPTLPQTNENKNTSLLILGMVLLLTVGGYIVYKKKHSSY